MSKTITMPIEEYEELLKCKEALEKRKCISFLQGINFTKFYVVKHGEVIKGLVDVIDKQNVTISKQHDELIQFRIKQYKRFWQ